MLTAPLKEGFGEAVRLGPGAVPRAEDRLNEDAPERGGAHRP